MAPASGPTAARARSPLPKQRLPPASGSSLLPPFSLDRASSSSVNSVSKPIRSGAAPRSTPGASSARRGPRFLACHICSRPFAAASLPIHVPQCLEKWRLEQAKLPKELRAKAVPAEKPIVPSAGGVVDVDEWNRAAEEQARAAMPAGMYFSISFAEVLRLAPAISDRISKHESVCEKNKAKTSTTVTTGLDSGKSARSLANDTARRARAHDAIAQQNKASNASYKAVDPSKRPIKNFGNKVANMACDKIVWP
ncbi:MAG: hypothetical protein BJ554DRAFT_164 [Olpidium bornovanus]|uniref:C2HC/C3H-type domain-containing protein n=1 Tax=Olpidium bornovanus TaxID=278681 RepID=A0A8H7ZTP9_9FUNG|nr:MAG: hypothetical protein BJ554DRAFT_164 [Olpidium bornovanus]